MDNYKCWRLGGCSIRTEQQQQRPSVFLIRHCGAPSFDATNLWTCPPGVGLREKSALSTQPDTFCSPLSFFTKCRSFVIHHLRVCVCALSVRLLPLLTNITHRTGKHLSLPVNVFSDGRRRRRRRISIRWIDVKRRSSSTTHVLISCIYYTTGSAAQNAGAHTFLAMFPQTPMVPRVRAFSFHVRVAGAAGHI